MTTKLAAACALLVTTVSVLGHVNSASAAGPGTIQGKVVDDQGNPLARVQVVATTESSSIPIKATTRKKGSFVVRTLDRGLVYQLRCRLEGFEESVVMVPPTQRDVNFVMVTMSRSTAPESSVDPTPMEASPTPEAPRTDLSEQRRAAIPVFNSGVEALQAGDLATAVARFEEASLLDPDFPEPHRALAAIAMDGEDYAAAAGSTERLLRLQPHDTEAQRSLYFAVLNLGDEKRLGPAARRLAAADPATAGTEMLEHSRKLFEENLFSLAHPVLEAILEFRPELAEAQYLYGLCCNSLGDGARAREAFAAFLELAPDHPDADSARALLEYLE